MAQICHNGTIYDSSCLKISPVFAGCIKNNRGAEKLQPSQNVWKCLRIIKICVKMLPKNIFSPSGPKKMAAIAEF